MEVALGADFELRRSIVIGRHFPASGLTLDVFGIIRVARLLTVLTSGGNEGKKRVFGWFSFTFHHHEGCDPTCKIFLHMK